MKSEPTIRVGLLGWGAIASQVGRSLLDGVVPGVELVAVSCRSERSELGVPQVDAQVLPDVCDLIVEAAGPGALHELGPYLENSTTDLLIVSVGALSDTALFKQLFGRASARTFLSSGAIGGLDVLGAASRFGSITSVQLTTTKPSAVLERPWMTPETIESLRSGVVTECFSGSAAEAVTKFPESVNVAATLACCVGAWELVTVRVVGDPTAARNVHEIVVDSQAGNYRFEISNSPSIENPRTSAITAFAVLRGIAAYARCDGAVL